MSRNIESKSEAQHWRDAVVAMFRLIFFRAHQAKLTTIGWRHFVIGLVCTWLVGMGRFWDNPRVGVLQHLGVGSVIYIFILSVFLWLVIWPLRPQNWSYFKVLTFISMVSPPAALYAIPVEKFVSLETANTINACLLAIVAGWRVALLIYYLTQSAQLEVFPTFVATFFPLTIIVVTLTLLNLDKVVFDAMGGIRDPSPNDRAYDILSLLSLFSIMLFIPLLICYLYILVDRFTTARYHVQDK
jgi:hypothetical protein